jgi:LysM repeat protein
VTQIKTWNHLRSNNIQIGQRLIIQKPKHRWCRYHVNNSKLGLDLQQLS